MDVQLFDTTLRDGTQSEGLSLSVEDKLKIARLLDGFGIHFIEGGYPGSNPKDVEFFQRAKSLHAQARQADRVRHDPQGGRQGRRRSDAARADRGARRRWSCIVGKSWDLHVTEVLGTTLEENLAMIARQRRVPEEAGQGGRLRRRALLRRLPRRPRYALATLKAAADAGADWITLCDTNGGSLPGTIARRRRGGAPGGPDAARHPHAQRQRPGRRQRAGRRRGRLHAGAGDDQRLRRALRQRQPDLDHPGAAAQDGAPLRPRREPGQADRAVARGQRDRQHPPARARALRRARRRSRTRAACTSRRSRRSPHSYEHVPPERVGNRRHIVVSELAGRGNVRMRVDRAGRRRAGQRARAARADQGPGEPGLPVRGGRGVVRAAGPAQRARLPAAVRGAGRRRDLRAAARQLDVRRGDGQAAHRRRDRPHRRRGRRPRCTRSTARFTRR